MATASHKRKDHSSKVEIDTNSYPTSKKQCTDILSQLELIDIDNQTLINHLEELSVEPVVMIEHEPVMVKECQPVVIKTDSETQTESVKNQTNPIYILQIQPWDCWAGPSDRCKQCQSYPVSSCEVSWVKDDHYEKGMQVEYLSEMCYPCVTKLIKSEHPNGFSKSQAWYYKYGFIANKDTSQFEM